MGPIDTIPGHKFPIGTTPKKNSVSELGVIFWGSLFLAVFGHSHVRGISTLNFGPISTKLGGTVQAIKKMTQNDNGPGLGHQYGETAVLRSDEKCLFWQKSFFLTKNAFYPKKNTQNHARNPD